MKSPVYILSAVRTPIGSFNGSLSQIPATKLGAIAVKGAVEKSTINPEMVDDVIMGHVLSANVGQAPARQAAKFADLPDHVNCTTVNKVCASGMKAIIMASQAIQLGDSHVVVAGGMENMSQVPYYIPKARTGYGYGHGEILDGLVKDGLTDVYDQCAMGVCGDNTAEKYSITRESQDEYAINSYKRSAKAWESRYFDSEIIPVEVKLKLGTQLISEDEEFRKVKFDKIPFLRPVFSKQGTVTAANASTINDGAAALVLASHEFVLQNQLLPIAKIIAYADAEQAPEWFTTAPILATKKVLEKANLSLSDIDFFEVNEAFAVVPLAYMQALTISPEKVNIFGGAVSLGHPLGASGARIVTTLLSVLKHKNAKYGLAAICNGGGGASAIIVEFMGQ